MPSNKTRVVALRQARQALSPAAFSWFSTQELLTAEELGTLLGHASPWKEVSRWRQQGRLVGIAVSRGYVYPSLQIDRERRRLRPDLVRLNVTRGAGRNPWTLIEQWSVDAAVADATPSSAGRAAGIRGA